jgi:hypothetical protein
LLLEEEMAGERFPINRAPVLTLWAAIVAERHGYDPSAALTLGRALAGLNAQSKGQRLGIYEKSEKKGKGGKSTPEAPAKRQSVHLLGREIPVVKTASGLRAAAEGNAIDPRTVQVYLEQRFGENLPRARQAMEALAKAFTPAELETRAFALYERFRPQVPEGKKGWGAKGELDLALIRSLHK